MPIAGKTEEERARLGTKWTCGACEVRFYDLHRTPTTCPKCGQIQDELVPETTKGRKPARKKAARKKKTAKAAKPRKQPKASRALDEEPQAAEETIELQGHQLGDDIATDAD